MRKALPVVIAMLVASPAFADVIGSGTIKSERRAVPAYVALSFVGAFDVEVAVAPGQPASVEIIGDDNVLPVIRTVVKPKERSLKIDSREGYTTKTPIRVRIVNPTLTALAIDGRVSGQVRGIKADQFALSVAGAGALELTGKVRKLAIMNEGIATIAARGLTAADVAANASGKAAIQVTATSTLAAVASGFSAIDYWGKPKVTQAVSGDSSISAR